MNSETGSSDREGAGLQEYEYTFFFMISCCFGSSSLRLSLLANDKNLIFCFVVLFFSVSTLLTFIFFIFLDSAHLAVAIKRPLNWRYSLYLMEENSF